MKTQREEAQDKLMKAVRDDNGIKTAEGVRALVNALFMTCRHADELTDRQLIDNMTLLSGMACGVLIEYADRLEHQ